jgi:hypothetical protein
MNKSDEAPEIVKRWEAAMPRVCWNCDYWMAPKCKKHGGEPPKPFRETDQACPDWEHAIPF